MKILIIGHAYTAAINRTKWQILSNLYPDLLLQVVVPTVWPTDLMTVKAYGAAEDNTKNCTFVALEARYVGSEYMYRYSWKALTQLIKRFNPDIIQVEQGAIATSYVQAYIIARAVGCTAKFIFFTWRNWEEDRSWRYKLRWRPLERLSARISDAVITGNNDAKSILRKKGFRQLIKVIPQLGADMSRYSPSKSGNRSSHIVLFVGRFVPEKGIILLAESFAQLVAQFPDWKLRYVGSGLLEETLRQTIRKLGISHAVEILPTVAHEAIPSLLQQADILVLPSYDIPTWKEQFGLVLAEAMATKIPVIGSTGGEIPHVIGDAGLIFEQKNGSMLTCALKTLMESRDLRQKFALAGYTRVKERFSREAIAREVVSLWRTIVEQRVS